MAKFEFGGEEHTGMRACSAVYLAHYGSLSASYYSDEHAAEILAQRDERVKGAK